MKKLQIIVISVLVIIVTTSFVLYKTLYNKQISYSSRLLDRQAQIVGSTIDKTNNGFVSDLNKIIYGEDFSAFFNNPDQKTRIIERLKIFFSKYEDLVTRIKLYDLNRNEFTLKKDETAINWLEQTFVLRSQGQIVSRDTLEKTEKLYEYYLPVLQNGNTVGNIAVTIDFQKYFSTLFSAFNLEKYQWQWVLGDSSMIIFTNSNEKLNISGISSLAHRIGKGEPGILVHSAESGGRRKSIISSFYPSRLLHRNAGLVFSSVTDNFNSYLIRICLLICTGAISLFLALVFIFIRHDRAASRNIARLASSEKMLFDMIEKMPVGIIIHNGQREILKANKAAAEQYSYRSETEMTGKVFPETAITDENNYFSKHLGGTFSPDQFVILRKEAGEVILFRTSMPVKYNGQDAELEILVDVTMLESARKQEASASTAKSEFLARMSYELRTPLNGIIGMTDILERQKLTDEARDVLNLLRRSAEVLLNIINDILDFSKIESGKMILDEIPFSLREEIVYCYDLARTSIDENEIKLTCDVGENIPDNLIGDPFRIRQILTNLLNHSIRNTSRGAISLTCNLEGEAENSLVLKFVLSDTGKSLDKATLKKLFGDNVNMESKVHGGDDGTGFSTILTRQLVELMNGKFSVESPSGLSGDAGTRIEFTISVYSNEKPVKNLSFEGIRGFGDIKTLVITGNQVRDEEILGSLHKLGLTLTVTTYQKSTINQIRSNLNFPKQRYNMVVLLNDSEFNGFEPARELKENNLSDRFFMMMISSHDMKGNLVKCHSLGIDHYVVKPFEIRELYDIIEKDIPKTGNHEPVAIGENNRTDLRILIVEDNKMNQKVIGTMLKSMGYSFDFADNGFAGFIQAKTRRYDVIFMDLLMPEMDGFESARKILNYDNSLLIVAFTADNLPDSRRKAELSGIREFIPKPIRIDDLKKFFSIHFSRS
jgi:signal transduction histidine kinase/DNA-binding response OmpR family regulator